MEETDFLYVFQKGFNFSQDGPGNRLVYHLAGCNLKCPWCSNPEGLKTGCGEKRSIREISEEIESCRMMFFDGGGVTFTGGEVTVQSKSLMKLIKELKSKGIHTCVETNASLENTTELLDEVDYMIADFKSGDEKKLKEVTGADLKTVFNNLLFRAKTKKPLLVRVPLINHFNTGEENAELIAAAFLKLKNESENGNLKFEILTYHEFGKEKWEKAGLIYRVTDGFVKNEDVLLLKNKIIENGLTLINT